MKRLAVLCWVLLFCPGCASDGDKGQWAEFWKDVRGDNMQMRNSFAGPRSMDAPSEPMKPPDLP
jgi:hypothetical protein